MPPPGDVDDKAYDDSIPIVRNVLCLCGCWIFKDLDHYVKEKDIFTC